MRYKDSVCTHFIKSDFSTDLAYFDGLNETILSAALVKPKQGRTNSIISNRDNADEILLWNYSFTSDDHVYMLWGSFFVLLGIFQPHIQYLLCLATPVDIVLLGVSFSRPYDGMLTCFFLYTHIWSIPCTENKEMYIIQTIQIHVIKLFKLSLEFWIIQSISIPILENWFRIMIY